MAALSGHGLAVELPRGWHGAIARRAESGALPVLHACSMPLSADRADLGGGVVERMGWGDVFIGLLEHDPACAGTDLFATEGVPIPLSPGWFRTQALQGMRPVQSGMQRFFSAGGRAFCLFVAIGEHARRDRLVPAADRVLATLAVTPKGSRQ